MKAVSKMFSYLVVILFAINFVFAQKEFSDQKWELAVNGIRLTENISLTIRENEFSNFELSLLEVPILLKVNINDKLSFLGGGKLDFYRDDNGFTNDIGTSVSLGIQYDVTPKTYIQGMFNYQLNDVNSIYHYNYGSKKSFMINTGFKF